MTGEHIIELLDRVSARELTPQEREAIESHVAGCGECLRAYRAFVISGKLISARAGRTAEPPAFFTKRVMAALRDKQVQQKIAIPLLWRSVRSVLATMVLLVVLLGILSIYVGRSNPGVNVRPTRDDLYSEEWVILDDGDLSADVTDNQVLTTLYESPDGYGHDN